MNNNSNSSFSIVLHFQILTKMVLCRVILGIVERVPLGSHQFHPSCENFDSVVDDIMNPECYIIWSNHMNMHILLEYIVSFKVPHPVHGNVLILHFQNSRTVFRFPGFRNGKGKGKLLMSLLIYLSTFCFPISNVKRLKRIVKR